MTTFLEFVRKLPGLPKGGESSLDREQWSLLVGEHLVGLYRKLYEKPLAYLRREDIETIDVQSGGLLSLHLAYDWAFADGRMAQASILAFDGTPVSAWRRQGHENDLEALLLLEPNTCARLARWVHEFAGRHALPAAKDPVLDVNAWLWDGNEHLAPAGSPESFFYTVLTPEALTAVDQLVTPTTYVPSIDGGLLPIYGLGAVQSLRGDGQQGLAAMAHTLNGPRSVDVRNLVHSVLPEDEMRGQDLEELQKFLAMDDYWFLETCTPRGLGWSCVVGVHRRGRVYLQWHVLHWTKKHHHKMVEWHHRVGERQPGTFGVDVIASMGWQLGE